MNVLHFKSIGDNFNTILNNGDQILIVDFLLLISQLCKKEVGSLQFLFTKGITQFLKLLAQGMPTTMLSHHKRTADNTHRLRRHDLIGQGVLEDTVLMNPCFVGEGVLPDNRLIGLDSRTRQVD